MIRLPTPPVPELARADTSSLQSAIRWFTDYFNRGGAPFNYRCSNKSVRAAYKGLHNLRILRNAAQLEHTEMGKHANDEVIQYAAPLAFGRNTQVIDLSPRRFGFGIDKQAAYRIPFFFIEDAVVNAYFLQPRKQAGLNERQMGFVASIVQKYLLEQEFYGERYNVEFVDVGICPGTSVRRVVKYKLDDLTLWSQSEIEDKLTVISEALDIVGASDAVKRKPRANPRSDAEMPLFD
jgi:hypothetical protein